MKWMKQIVYRRRKYLYFPIHFIIAIYFAVVDKKHNDNRYSIQSTSWSKSFKNSYIKYVLNDGEVKIYIEKVDGFDENNESRLQISWVFLAWQL